MKINVVNIVIKINVLLTLSLLLACNKDKNYPTPYYFSNNQPLEPCQPQEVNAIFFLEEVEPDRKLYTDTDTMYANRSLRFRAKESNAEYIWYINGDKTDINQQKIELFFGENRAGEDITVSLVVKKTPNKDCFPDDDGYDSITRKIHIASAIYNWEDDYKHPLVGSYRFYAPHIEDSIDIKFDVFKSTVPFDYKWYFKIQNFDGEGTNINYPDWVDYIYANYHKIHGGIRSMEYGRYRFYIVVDIHKDAYFILEKVDKNSNIPEYRYKGRRL